MEKPTEEAPEAGKEQEKAPEKEKKKESLSLRIQNSKVVIWIGIISAVLGIVGFVQAIVTDSNKPELSVSLNYHNRELQVGQADTLLPTVKPRFSRCFFTSLLPPIFLMTDSSPGSA